MDQEPEFVLTVLDQEAALAPAIIEKISTAIRKCFISISNGVQHGSSSRSHIVVDLVIAITIPTLFAHVTKPQ